MSSLKESIAAAEKESSAAAAAVDRALERSLSVSKANADDAAVQVETPPPPPDEPKVMLHSSHFPLLVFAAFCQSFSWQCFLPVLSVSITDFFDRPTNDVAIAFGVFTLASIGMMLQIPMLMKMTNPRVALILFTAIRLVSGICHIIAFAEGLPVSVAMGLVYGARALQGFSMASYPIILAWVGIYSSAEQKASRIAMANGAMTVGSVLGPQITIVIAAFTRDNPAARGAAPGYVAVIVSAILIPVLMFFFTDDRQTPTPPKAGDTQLEGRTKLVVILTCINQALSWGGFTAFEATLSLAILEEYGWEPGTHYAVAVIWSANTIAMIVGIGLFGALHKTLSFLQLVTIKLIITTTGILILINWLDLSAAVAWQRMAVGVLCITAGEMMAIPVHQTIMSQALPPALQVCFSGCSSQYCQLTAQNLYLHLGQMSAGFSTSYAESRCAQMKFNGILNIFSTCGRGASPFIASLIMSSLEASQPEESHLSSNALFAFQVTLCLAAALIPLLGFRAEYYGEWLKESPKKEMH